MSGINYNELVDGISKVEERCLVSLWYKKAPFKPVVGFSLSKDIYDVLLLDLKKINGHKILHIIDYATQFSAAIIVKYKHKEEIVRALFNVRLHYWEP